MPFESLSQRHAITIDGFPSRWLPLTYLYDADLPLFPIYYFHTIPEGLYSSRPQTTNRVFGYVETIGMQGPQRAVVSVVTNKDLEDPENRIFREAAENEIRERFGIADAVVAEDMKSAFRDPAGPQAVILSEIWDRVVKDRYGNKLPFGKLWDGTLGLARHVASWNSPSGRKGELIQTHYFASKFGVPIQCGGGIQQVDFFLLPTVMELTDTADPLSDFPQFGNLLTVAAAFNNQYCRHISLGGQTVSAFNNPNAGRFATENLMGVFRSLIIPHEAGPAAKECFNAFNKGPPRTVLFLMLLDDIRNRRLRPLEITSPQMGSIYEDLRGTYQAPKAIAIYAQQCFGNQHAMPIDTWVETFMQWPLSVYPTGRGEKIGQVFREASNLGKVERLIWVAAQARKVHSSACNNALWCLKHDSTGQPRGSNPLACNICLTEIRENCPAYGLIRHEKMSFNGEVFGARFLVKTSHGNNSTSDQTFLSCSGYTKYGTVSDDFSTTDVPEGFGKFPARDHDGRPIKVEDFVRIY